MHRDIFAESSFRYYATVPPCKCLSDLTSDAIPNNSKDCGMKSKIMFASVLAGLLAIPLVANAQGIPDGIQHGASVGSQSAGPVGAVVGGAVGGVIGGVEGLVGGVEGVFGLGPTYVAYPAPAPVVSPRHRFRYAHRHVHPNS
jgi:hypothetical protein